MDIRDLRKDITWKYSYLANQKNENDLTCNCCVKIAKVGLIEMLYELYKKFYFNLYDI